MGWNSYVVIFIFLLLLYSWRLLHCFTGFTLSASSLCCWPAVYGHNIFGKTCLTQVQVLIRPTLQFWEEVTSYLGLGIEQAYITVLGSFVLPRSRYWSGRTVQVTHLTPSSRAWQDDAFFVCLNKEDFKPFFSFFFFFYSSEQMVVLLKSRKRRSDLSVCFACVLSWEAECCCFSAKKSRSWY